MLPAYRPDTPDAENWITGSRAERPADVFGGSAHFYVTAHAEDLPSDRVEVGGESGDPFEGQPVLGGTGAVHLPVGEPRTRWRAARLSMAASISAEPTLYCLANVLSRGSRQPGS